MKQTLLEFLAVGLASAFGGMARFAIARLLNADDYPYGTFLINISGCFLIGWFLTAANERHLVGDLASVAIAVGFIGTYTTFSTYMFESDKMIQHGLTLRAIIYLTASVLLGLLAVRAGVLLARR